MEALQGHLRVIGDEGHRYNCLKRNVLRTGVIPKHGVGVFARVDLEPRWLVARYFGFKVLSKEQVHGLGSDSSLRGQVDTHGFSCGCNGQIIVGVTGEDLEDKRFVEQTERVGCCFGSLINDAWGEFGVSSDANCRLVWTGDSRGFVFVIKHIPCGAQLLLNYGSSRSTHKHCMGD